MSFAFLNLFLNIAIMAALVVTIFYARRLSRNLQNFRDNRDAFMNLITDLSGQIEEAQTAVNRLNDAGHKTGQDLQKAVHEARGILTELQVVNQSASGLASRLEKLKDSGKPASSMQGRDFAAKEQLDSFERGASFFIQDRDFGAGEAEDDFDEEEGSDVAFQSKAEKDLWKALRRNKKFTGPGLS